MLGRIYHENLLWTGSNRDTKSKYNIVLAHLISKHVYSPCIVDWVILNTLGCAETFEEMLEIKFDEEVNEDELTSKKLIKFRLGGRGYSLNLLEFARRLGLYTSFEIREEGFEAYFQGGLRNDDYFNANDYWVNISSEDQLRLSRSDAQAIRSPIMRVLQKMITYGLCQRTIVAVEIVITVLSLLISTSVLLFTKLNAEVSLVSALQVLRILGNISTLVYSAGWQLNAAPVLEVENFTNWKKRFMCHIIGIEPQFENIIKNGPFIPMIAGQRKPEGEWTADERKASNLDHRLKSLIMSVLPDDQINSIQALMNELVNDGITLSKLKINNGFINGLPKKWLSFCQSLKNINHVKDSELASLFGKLKYEENLIDSIYETEKNKSLVSATPLSTAFISTSIVQDFHDSPNDEEDTRSIYGYLNDLEEEYQARTLLAKSKRFFKKGTQRFSNAKATDQTECHKCGKKAQTRTKAYQGPRSLIQQIKAKLALLSLSASTSKIATIKNKGLIAKAYEWDEEEVSSDDNKIVEVKLLMALDGENDNVSKEGARNAEDFILPNHDTGKILPAESQRNTTDLSVAVTDSSATNYDSADESSVYSTPLPPLKKLDGAEPIFGPKTIKSILRSKSTFKAETLKGVIIYEPSSALAKDNKSSSASKVNSAPAGKLKSCDIKKPIWYLDSGCSRHMTGVKSYLHKYEEQPGPKVVFGDDSTCTTKGYGSIKCNGIVFTKVAFVDWS
ncbi:hypothetical protein Tco_0241075 [Tanacetum coccineum]